MSPRTVAVVATAVVAVVAAVTSYDHMRVLAERAGEAWKAFLVPLAVDGLVVSASTVLIARRRAGRSAGLLPWLAWLGGVGASVAANVAAAQPTTVGRLVALVPPLALAVSFELLRSLMAAAHPASPTLAPVPAPAVVEDPPRQIEAGESDLLQQAAAMVAEADQNGTKVSRRALAQQLGVTEYRARGLLQAVTT
jgi:hypothetical protein